MGDFADELNYDKCGSTISDEIAKYQQADFSSEDYYAEGHVGNFDVLKFWHQKKA